jgi:glycosyltransferase involved in cell wall biosynthesis
LLGISYSFTAHARDLYQLAQPALAERTAAASAVITCCSANVVYLQQVTPASAQAKVRLIHHGVNLEKFKPAPRMERLAASPLILSVGRLVEKKGFPDLLHACQRLKQAGHRFRCLIYGDGPLQRELATLIEQLGLADDVRLAGACTQEALLPIFQQADIFVLTPYVTEDGDRDGVPNVLVEAMACGLPVVSTTAGSIPDLVIHDHNGMLAAPHDIQSIASGLATLLCDEPRRKRLGAAARHTVVEHFDLSRAAQQLAALFEQAATREPC